MSQPGEWITFDELCARVPAKSARTLRRYVKARVISSRQLGGRGGRLEFNWRTVARELAALQNEGVNAAALASAPAGPSGPPDFGAQLAELRDLVGAVAKKLGVAS